MYHLEEESGRQIARELGCSRPTVSRALSLEQPPTYTMSKPRSAPVLGPYQARREELLAEKQRLPKKQRYTAHKLFQVIQAEGYVGSEAGVQMYAVRWRKVQKRPATFLPREFEPGQDAQVDWGEAQVMLKGEQHKVQVCVMHLASSRRTFVMTFPAQKQEAFFSGHVCAFAFFGGVPHRDAVRTIFPLPSSRWCRGASAKSSARSLPFAVTPSSTPTSVPRTRDMRKEALRGRWGIPRSNFLVPLPRVASFEELNQHVLEQCLRDAVRVVDRQAVSIGQAWKREQPFLRPLPKRPFDCGVTRQVHRNGARPW
jgi:transposase